MTPSLRSELEKRGVNIAEVFNQTRAGIVRASVEFNKDARALIRALNSTNIADMVHELGHIFRRDLSAADMAAVEKWAGVINGKWTEAAEELWATGFERYLAEGKAPTSSMKGVFAQFKEWLADIYGAIIGSDIDVNVSDEVKEIMERLVSGPKPEKTLSGQKILPGMEGRAEEIDRSEFVRKHQSVLLDDMRELVDDEEMIDALREPVGNILKAVWNGDLKEDQDLYDTDLGNDSWTALTAMIAYHAPAKREAGLESIADEAIRRAFTHRDSIKPKAAEKSAEPAESDFKAGIRAEIARQLAEETAAAAALSKINIGDKVQVVSTGELGQVQTIQTGRGALVGVEGVPGSKWIPLSDLTPSSHKDAIDQLVDQVSAKPAKSPRKPRTSKTDTTPKPPRTKIGEKLGNLSEDTGAEAKQAFETWLKGVKGLPLNSALGPFNPELAKMTVTMVRAQVKDKVVKFADLVARIAEWSSPAMASSLSDYIEAAWDILRETDSRLDKTGKVADILGPETTITESKTPEVSSESPALVLVESLNDELLKSRGIDAKKLWELADKAYGGTRAEGKYGPSEAYDALETAINLTILDARAMGMKTPAGQVSPEVALKHLLDMQKQIVSQTNRSGTKDTMQQFSTPPAYSYVVSQFVNMDARDVVLEPSAGTGDLAVHALNQRARVHVNELDPKRAEMLQAVKDIAEDRLTISTEDALQLGNIMGANLRPSVVLMNPPFSREGQRMGDKKMSGNDRNHIDAAMASLIDGGRLVAIIGAGLHGPSKGFTKWLADIAKKHNVRANIDVSRDVYKGYGTTFPTRVLVIDKGTPTPKDGTLTAQADSLEHLLTMTKGIRDARNRSTIQPVAPGQNVAGNVGTTEGGKQPESSGGSGTATSSSGKPHGNTSSATPKAPRGTSGTGDTNVADDARGRPDSANPKGARSDTNAGGKSTGGGTTDAAGEPTGNLAGQSPKPRRVDDKRTEIDESVLFEPYQPSIVPFPNAKPHPTAAVESAAMSAVDYPEVNEVPNIDASIIEDGRLSDVQLEFVALAAHAHNQTLPSEERTGILFGDGTGMGKGRGIPGVILHNWNEGRRQAIWMSKNGKLHSDAMAEWEELGGNPAQVANLSDMSVDNEIDLNEGILFATYDTLKSRGKSGKTRAQQVIDWLPKDFDGVIAFDEAHLMGSSTAARAGVARDIQDKFPKARVVYASATAATEIDQLMFGSRLGLWGAATPFATATEFAAKIGAAGVSAMESVALSLKAMGRYVSRSISFNDGTPDGTVGYNRLNHPLADHQIQMYDRLAEAWQNVIGEFEDALDETGADNFAKGFARGQFWSSHQRFFNDLVTSLQMPTVIEAIEKDMAEGRSVVIQLTTTGAAQQARALAGRGTESLDDFAVDPFSALVELVRSQFPTQAYEDYVKDDGSVGKRPVVDSAGKPVKDAAAVAKQQQLLSDLADMEQAMPESPLDMILNYFGTENVAEVTGRNQRVVWEEQQDGTKKRVLEKRSQKKSNQSDIDAFQSGKKRILIFSQAGGTGASYHADRRASNQQKRMHYLVQPGWVAADAIQGLGRTHRTNQKQAPEYILVQTDIPGQKRFISTIARRLTQLGALTRGQRTAGGSGVFDASDNLESKEAALALTEFFKSLETEDSVMPIDEFEQQTGLELRLPSTGALKSDANLPTITSFMNRLLSMTIESQNKVFDQFDRTLKTITEARRISGELDQGVETIKGSNIRKTRDEVVFTHDSGAKTRYVQLTMEVPIPSRDFETQSKAERFKDFVGYYKRKSDGRVFFVNESFAKTTKSGQVVDMIRLVPPYGESLREEEYKLRQGTLDEITAREAESLWNEQFGNRPKTKSQKVDMITGAVLPVWDRLPQLQPKLSRALTASGDMVLGVVLPPSKVNETLGKLGAEKNKVDVGDTIKMLRTGKGDVQLVNGWKIQRARVQNEWRLEIVGPTPVSELVFQRQGVITERIGFKARYFIPFGDNTQTVFDAVTQGNPVQKVNRYDSTDAGDIDEADGSEPDTVAEPEPESDTSATPVESEARKSAREAQEAVDAQKAENARLNKIIVDELRKDTLAGAGIPVSKELATAVAGRLLGSIRLETKRFDLLIKELRAEFEDTILIQLKQKLIQGWNSLKDKYGLDDATEAVFDAAMSSTVDVDVEQAVAAMTPEPASNVAEDERTYSTKNEYTDAERQRLDMPERPPVETQSRQPSIDLAAEIGKTKAGADRIDKLIVELKQFPRAVNPLENDLLNYRYAELDARVDDALQAKYQAEENGDDTQAAVNDQIVRESMQAQQDLIQFVDEPIGTAAGRALQARKAVIKRDFTMARSLLLFKATHGREADPDGPEYAAMKKQIDDLNAAIAALDEKLAAADAKANDLETRLKESHDTAVSDVNTPEPTPAPTPAAPPSAPPKATSVIEKLAEEGKDDVNRGFKRLSAMLGKAYSIEAVGQDIALAFIDIAKGYSKQGVVKLADFLNRVGKRMGPDAKKYTEQMIAAWKHVRSTLGPDDISRITDKIDIIDPETIGRAARDLHRYVIERDGLDASADGRDAAVSAVYEILVDIIPEITADEVARAMSGIGIYSELSQDEIDVIRRDQKAQLLSLEQIADWKKGTPPPATGQERAPVSDEQRLLRRMVNEAKKASGVDHQTEGQLSSALSAAKRMAQNRITDLTNALSPGGDRIKRSKTVLKSDTELDALRAERDALQYLYDEVYGKNELTDEQRISRTETMLDRAILGLESDLKKGRLYKDAKQRSPVTSHAIEAKKAALDALKASREEMRLQSGEAQARSDAAFERHLTEKIATLAKRLAEKDYAPKPKKPEREFTPEMLADMLTIEKMKQEINRERKEWEFSQRHIVYRTWMKGPVAGAHMVRKGLTSIDQSLIGRQGGLLGVTNPKIWAKAGRKAFASNMIDAKSIFTTEQDLFNTEAALDADARWVRMEKIGKLAVTGVHGGVNREEDARFVPEWFDKLPGIGGSERAGSAFINTQRRLVFRSLVDKLATKLDGKRSVSNAELRVIANFVNVSSGRGTIGAYTSALDSVTTVFFSPRWWASRINVLSGQPIWHGAQWTGENGASAEVRKMIAVEWAKQAAGQVAIMGIAVAALTAAFGAPGDDEEWDWYYHPKSPKFGNIRIGSSYVDLTFGLGQHLSYLVRMLTGQQIDRWETRDIRSGELFGKYMRGKLAPVASVAGDYLVGKSIGGEEFGSAEWFKSHVTPLMVQDIEEASTEGPILGTALSLLMFFGANSQTYDARVKERKDIANELRAMTKQGASPDKIKTTLDRHLAHAAGLEAKQDLRTAKPEDVAGLQKIIDGTASPELTAAIQKEKYDIILNASGRVSTDPKRLNEDKEFSGSDDNSRMTSRSLIKSIAPTEKEAIALYEAAYRAKNHSLYETNGEIKASVYAGRARIKSIYKQ